jgi:hypothetical protein
MDYSQNKNYSLYAISYKPVMSGGFPSGEVTRV